MFFCEFCKISKNTFFNRIPLVAASAVIITFPQLLLAHFARANQARGFSMSRTFGAVASPSFLVTCTKQSTTSKFI